MNDQARAFGGKTAIVTGGASGIGKALARVMAKAGAEVVLADRQLGAADEFARELRDGGHRATAVELDVRDLSMTTRVVDETAARTKRIDYFFNNAGIGVGGEMDGYAREDWDDVFDVNLKGVAYGVQAVYPRMVAQGSGHIVNTASMAGLVGAAGEGSYTAAKHAVVGLSKALRIEAKRHGVRVSVLCPGAIRTPILSGGKYGRLNFEGISEDQILKMWAALRPMDVDAFARAAIAAILANEAIIVLPRWWKAFWYVERISPAASARVWGLILDKMRRDIAATGAHARSALGRDRATASTSTTSTNSPAR